MLTLIIDTSTEKSFIALANGDEIIHFQVLSSSPSSRALMSSIETLFLKAQVKPHEIEAIGVGVGPGAFTGMRVGVATAKGLAYPKKLPLLSFSTLAAFTSSQEGPFVSLIDARMGGAYLLFQERRGTEIKATSEPILLNVNDLHHKTQGFSIVGPSFSRLSIEGACEVDPNPFHIASLLSTHKPKDSLELLYMRNLY